MYGVDDGKITDVGSSTFWTESHPFSRVESFFSRLYLAKDVASPDEHCSCGLRVDEFDLFITIHISTHSFG